MRLAVFASGGGSNFAAILDAIARGVLPATVVLLVADRAGTGAQEKAEQAGIPAVVCDPRDSGDEHAYGQVLLDTLHRHGADFIALAGFLKKVPAAVVAAFPNRILNIHPSLLPAFGGHGLYGRRVHEAVLAAGVRWTGATVHLVDEQYDTGPIVLQDVVPVLATDTPQTLAARVLVTEHALYPEALRLFATNKVRVENGHVILSS